MRGMITKARDGLQEQAMIIAPQSIRRSTVLYASWSAEVSSSLLSWSEGVFLWSFSRIYLVVCHSDRGQVSHSST